MSTYADPFGAVARLSKKSCAGLAPLAPGATLARALLVL